MLKTKYLFLSLLAVAALAGCNRSSDPTEVPGRLSFSLGGLVESVTGRQAETAVPASILITVKDGQGNLVYSQEKLNIYPLGDGYITNPVNLEPGDYTLEEFLVLDSAEAVVYLTPIQGSQFADLIPEPLPVAFSVTADLTTEVTVDVLPADLGDAAKFGYATFGFNIVQAAYFRPDSTTGKDAVFGLLVPDNNYGDIEDIHLYAWTQNGDLNVNRFVIDFALESLPDSITIDSAFLSMYFNYSSGYIAGLPGADGHFGDNAFFVESIVEDWNEQTVTWNTQPATDTTGRLSFPASTSFDQDYTRMDVTDLIVNQYENPGSAHGLMFKLENEVKFKVMFFASSNHPDETIRPTLVVYYH
ncbi:MAG TPA: hypothetical protein DCE41_28340 [Cytophagales bacterium]|nr:hypothetical protein [Cytophagales bacterium]HAA18419.1 hypothetical protein [Cytophagales bacterium]HAP61466.1 hypothetical protein [Cytophagales bacterium]